MYRTAIESLYRWKDDKFRKPLVIEGARQVGKTWLMKTFGQEAYEDTVYINFDTAPELEQLFATSLKVEQIVMGLEVYAGRKIDADKTLIIFDEIQQVPRALASLKYFCENAPQYHIVCAGSLLGIALHSGTTFPVGKVDFLKLYPLTFDEFLMATGRQQYADLLKSGNNELMASFSRTYIEALKQYCFVGGMPEAVAHFAENNDFAEVRRIQSQILAAYEQDFSKHAPHNVVPRIRMLWNSVPSQLAKENRKFLYGFVREGARAKDYETAIMWLSDCGLIHKIHRVSRPGLPLKAYEDLKSFKLFLLDIGLLGCMVGINQQILLNGDALFTEFKGAMTEQYVLQQLVTLPEIGIYYYTNDRGTSEIDFLLDVGTQVVPLEVKASTNLKAKSLKAYREKYAPALSVRSSMADYRQEEGLLNLPRYAISNIKQELAKY